MKQGKKQIFEHISFDDYVKNKEVLEEGHIGGILGSVLGVALAGLGGYFGAKMVSKLFKSFDKVNKSSETKTYEQVEEEIVDKKSILDSFIFAIYHIDKSKKTNKKYINDKEVSLTDSKYEVISKVCNDYLFCEKREYKKSFIVGKELKLDFNFNVVDQEFKDIKDYSFSLEDDSILVEYSSKDKPSKFIKMLSVNGHNVIEMFVNLENLDDQGIVKFAKITGLELDQAKKLFKLIRDKIGKDFDLGDDAARAKFAKDVEERAKAYKNKNDLDKSTATKTFSDEMKDQFKKRDSMKDKVIDIE